MQKYYPIVHYPQNCILNDTEERVIKNIKEPDIIKPKKNLFDIIFRRKELEEIEKSNKLKINQYEINNRLNENNKEWNDKLKTALSDKEGFESVMSTYYYTKPDLMIVDRPNIKKVKKGLSELKFKKLLKNYFTFYLIHSPQVHVQALWQMEKLREIGLRHQEDLSYGEGDLGFYSSNLLDAENEYKSYLTNDSFLYPDFLINGFHTKIIIEVDEPYTIDQKLPIHCIDNNFIHEQRSRDMHLLETGVIIIRFAEIQVVKNPLDCISFIFSTLEPFAKYAEFKQPKKSKLEKVPCWTKEQSLNFIKSKYRESYLQS